MANNVVKIKRTATSGKVPNTVNLPNAGELALNMTDGILYSTNGSNIFAIGANNVNISITNNISVGSNVIINTSAISVGNASVNTQITSSQVNTDIIQLDVAAYVGDNVDLTPVALIVGNSTVNSVTNSTAFRISNSSSSATVNTDGIFLTNAKRLVISPLAGGSNVYFSQQNDDNFVFYSTNTLNQPKPVWSIFANSTTSNLQIHPALQPLSGIVANGSLGTSGHVLYSNGSGGGLYWGSATAGSVDQNAQYTWTNTHSFSNTITFTGSILANTVNATSFTAGATGTGTGGSVQNTTTVFVGNNTVNSALTSAGLTVNGTTVVNSSVVNTASHTVGTSFVANSSGVYHTGVVNAATLSVGSSIVANSSRFVIGTAVGLQANGGIGTSGQVLTSNATTVYWSTPTTGTVTSVASGNGLSGGPITGTGTLSVLANNGIIANSTGIFVNGNTGLVTNSTGVHVNANNGITANSTGTFVFGNTGLVVNSTGVHVNSSYIGTLTANNATNLGGVAAASYVQNTDSRTLSGNLIFSGANVSFTGNARITGGLIANGSLGAAGQVLHSNGSSVYWDVDDNTGTVTSVASGNGLSGGPITSTGTLSVLANNGIVANSTGVFVNANTGLVANSTGVFFNQNGQYTFTNTQTFSNTTTFGNSTVNVVANSTTVQTPVGFMNKKTLDFNYTYPNTFNTVIAGPFTVSTGITMTIESGARVSIV